MPKLNVILRKEDLDPDFLHDKVAVVIDVLFATSTIITALHQGATEVHVTSSSQQASESVRNLPEGSFLLAGESHLNRIPGFASYAPLALSSERLRGRRLVYYTTNGTVALRKADTARHVYAAALLNGPAMVQQLLQHSELSLVFICSGSAGRINLEDLFAAGYLAEQLELARPGHWQPTDTCSIARAVYRQYADKPQACLFESQLGRQSESHAMCEEINYAAQLGLLDIIPKLNGQYLVAV